ncbi:Phage Tail Collar Domain [Providencia rustigianii]|uniref:Phage Tail Collar Domain n=1 Tax=Providencia rustigianii TaxID=158850 RepID=A0A379G2U6_9GAMM|nr:phage tail protein [Providencia rustigianii]SUC35245.1 Phage Tail Collar Domain [Providencia rustigianii]
MKYFALLTKLGENLLAQATALGTKLELTHMSVGDGGGALPTPDTNQTKLIAEKRRAAINTLFIDDKNKNQIIAEQIIPESEGGWWIREIGLFDKAGNLIAIANCPETYKPQLAEGSGRTQSIRIVLIVSHTESVTLKIDPSVVLATRDYVNTEITVVDKKIDALSAQTKLDLNKKFDKANISSQKGNDNDKVPSLHLFTGEIGKLAAIGYSYSKVESDNRFQPKGNYAPAGNYADGNLFTIGTSKKETWVYTPDKSKVLNINDSGLSGVYDWKTNRYLWGFNTEGIMSSGLVPLACGGTNARNASDARKNLNAIGVGDLGIGLTPSASTNMTQVDDIDRWDLLSGFHKVSNSSKGTRPTGVPATTGFLLFVGIFGTANAAAYVTQTASYYSDNNSNTYRRSFNPVDKKWTVWKKQAFESEIGECPVGAPIPWPQSTAPTGYLVCNGQSFNKTTYPLLTKAYPTGVLPDLRGEFIRGLDAGRGVDANRVVLSTQSDENREHTHTIGMKHGSGNGSNEQVSIRSLAINVSNATYTTEKSGGKESRPRNIAFLYIVRAA